MKTRRMDTLTGNTWLRCQLPFALIHVVRAINLNPDQAGRHIQTNDWLLEDRNGRRSKSRARKPYTESSAVRQALESSSI